MADKTNGVWEAQRRHSVTTRRRSLGDFIVFHHRVDVDMSVAIAVAAVTTAGNDPARGGAVLCIAIVDIPVLKTGVMYSCTKCSAGFSLPTLLMI